MSRSSCGFQYTVTPHPNERLNEMSADLCLSLSYQRFSNFSVRMPWLMDLKLKHVIECPRLLAPLRGFINRHCEEPGCSFQTLEGRSLIGYYSALFKVMTFTFSHYDQSRHTCISSGAVGIAMRICLLGMEAVSCYVLDALRSSVAAHIMVKVPLLQSDTVVCLVVRQNKCNKTKHWRQHKYMIAYYPSGSFLRCGGTSTYRIGFSVI